jgi:hypothetical protein
MVVNGRQTDGAEHSQVIFRKTVEGVADGPDHPGGKVVAAADVVDHTVVKRIEEEAVDGKVAATGVFDLGSEDDRVGVPAVGVGPVGAKRATSMSSPTCGRATEFAPDEEIWERAPGRGSAWHPWQHRSRWAVDSRACRGRNRRPEGQSARWSGAS